MKTSLLGFLIAAALPSAAFAAPVTIDLSGIRAADGDLFVSLQTRDQFMKNTGAYGTIVVKPAPGARSVVLDGVAPGTYAAAIWHDVNGNKTWDAAAGSGDGWAMIDADKLRAKPEFDQVSFTVGDAPARLTLDMRYGY